MIERQTNPLKQWKLSTVDALAQAKWDEYTSHKEVDSRKDIDHRQSLAGD